MRLDAGNGRERWLISDANTVVTLVSQIGALFDVGAVGALPDRCLVDHFARRGEHAEVVFATLVERHGPMVLSVCRQVLADRHLADDAFQVTFLLLARRASSIHDPDKLAAWLHRVARRVSLRARARLRRRGAREVSRTGEVAVSSNDPLERNELGMIVHEEIDRLADTQRLPILLCALEGLSHEEAAERLRWPLGTLKSRLVRGRRRLQGRLARRGLAPAVAVAAVIADTPASAAPVPLALAMTTTRAAFQSLPGTTSVAASISRPIAALLEREIRAMLLAKIWLAVGSALAAAAAILIGIALAGPLKGSARRSPTLRDAIVRIEVDAPAGPDTDFTSGTRSDREDPPALRGTENVQRPAGHFIPPDPPRDEKVERAIRQGVQFLKARQQPDGSWPDVEPDAQTGLTSLVTLALIAAGEKPDSPPIESALACLRRFRPVDLRSTYAVALQTMAFAAVEPQLERGRIAVNVSWLENAQIKPGHPQPVPGSWTYSDRLFRPGDNSNTQYALLGLHAASEAGVPTRTDVWESARRYWESAQKKDGSWGYTAGAQASSASMTCAGISSLATARLHSARGREILEKDAIKNCGAAGPGTELQKGTTWLADHFRVDENFGSGQQWKYYYLHGLERAGRMTGLRILGLHDWYRQGAEELLRAQDKLSGSWQGVLVEQNEVLSTSFAVIFLAQGRAPVLINKLRHRPANDWDNDPDDVGNLVGEISREWKRLLTWQTVDSRTATLSDLLRAPILFINGHKAPEFAAHERQLLNAYIEGGGCIVAEACCGSADFDRGFRSLIKELFPDDDAQLRPLPADHPLWQAQFRLLPEIHPLWGIRQAGKTAIIYSPTDLSCYWNQLRQSQANPEVKKAVKVGKNIVEYLTGLELPAGKPPPLEVPDVKGELPKRGALGISKLKHSGDWNIAPKAIGNGKG
jgi:RNA polymerase sigma factor (sigma-70 family)